MHQYLYTDKMKKLFITISFTIVAICFFCCGNNIKGKETKTPDTLAIIEGKSEALGYGRENSYYAVCGKDTLNLSCRLFVSSERKTVNIDFEYLDSRPCSPIDTAFLDGSAATFEGYKKTSYRQQLHLMELFLERIASTNVISRLATIQYDLIQSGSLNAEISSIMLNDRGIKIEDAVRTSSLYRDMNLLLMKYGMTVGDVFVDKYCFVDKDTFLKNNVADSLPLTETKKFLSTYVCFKIRELQGATLPR